MYGEAKRWSAELCGHNSSGNTTTTDASQPLKRYQQLSLSAPTHPPAILTALSTNSATWSKSDSTKPLLVRAGLPMRRPPGTMALTSPGTVFLLAVEE